MAQEEQKEKRKRDINISIFGGFSIFGGLGVSIIGGIALVTFILHFNSSAGLSTSDTIALPQQFKVYFEASPASGAVVTAAMADTGAVVTYGQEVPRGTHITFTAIINDDYIWSRWSSQFGNPTLEVSINPVAMTDTDLAVPFNMPIVQTTTLPINADTRVIANLILR